MKTLLRLAAAIGSLILNPAYAEGDIARGQTLFRTCAFCHSVEDGKNGIGPSLQGVIGRRVAGVANYPYSEAFKRLDYNWDAATLDSFLAAPMNVVAGTKMTYMGLAEAQDRADVIAYLQALQR